MTETTHTTIANELRAGKTVTYFTVGSSMKPLLVQRKTHVTVAPLKEAKNGDILLYIRKNGSRVLHRCIKQDGGCYYMRGDNTCGLERIKKEQALGVVTHIYRKGKCFNVKKSKPYLAYVALWRLLYPCRWFVYKLKGLLRRLK